MPRFRTVSQGKYRNPYTDPSQQRGRGVLSKLKIIGIAGLVLLLTWLFFTSKFFSIQTIEVTGSHLVSPDTITSDAKKILQGEWFNSIPRSNVALVGLNHLDEHLMQTYPFVRVTIKRHLLHTLRISVEERTPRLMVLVGSDHTAVVDDHGLAIFTHIGERTTTTSSSEKSSVAECTFCDTLGGLPHIMVSSTPPTFFTSGSQIIPAGLASSLLSIEDLFTTHALPIDFVVFDSDDPSSVEIHLKEGFKVYLDVSKPLDAQFEHLNAFLLQKFPKVPRHLNYIDVRYGSRVYYQ